MMMRKIKQVEAENTQLRTALMPFADAASFFDQLYLDTDPLAEYEMSDQSAKNTDSVIWRENEDDAYADSIHITQSGSVGISVGGYVIVKPLREWHKLAWLHLQKSSASMGDERKKERKKTNDV